MPSEGADMGIDRLSAPDVAKLDAGRARFVEYASGVLAHLADHVGDYVPEGVLYADRPQRIVVEIDQSGSSVSTDFGFVALGGGKPPRPGGRR